MEKRIDPMTGILIENDEANNRYIPNSSDKTTVLSEDDNFRQAPYNQNINQNINQSTPVEMNSNTYEYNSPDYIYTAYDEKPKRSFNFKIFIIPLAAVICLAAIIFSLYKFGVIGTASHKLSIAAMNTYKDAPEIFKQFDLGKMTNILLSKKSSYEFELSNSNYDFGMAYINSKNNKQLYGEMKINDGKKMDVLLNLNKEELQVGSSLFNDCYYTYNYNEEGDGYVFDLLEQLGVESDVLNKNLKEIFKGKKDDSWKKFAAVIKDEYKSLKFNKIESELFEVGKEDVKCKGYNVVVSSDNIENIIDGWEEVCKDEYEEDFDNYDIDIDEYFDEMRMSLTDEWECDVTVYVYKNKLAAIIMEIDDVELQILLQGREKRTYDIEIIGDDELMFSIEGEMKDSVEYYEMKNHTIDDDNLITLSYDVDKDEFSYYETSLDSYTHINGEIGWVNNKFFFAVNDVEKNLEDSDIRFEFVIKKDAEVMETDGTAEDITDMKEEEFLELYQNIYANINGM